MKKLLAMILALLMVVSLVACSDSKGDKSEGGSSKGEDKKKASSYEDAIDLYMDYQGCEATKKSLEQMAPAEYWEVMEDLDDAWEEYQENAEYMMEMYEEEYGANIKISYEIIDEYEYDEDELAEVAEYLEDTYDIDPDTVEEALTVDVEATIEGDDAEETDETSLELVKIDGKWYILDLL